MNEHLLHEMNTMSCDSAKVKVTTETDQDFLFMSKLMKITRTNDFEPEELEYYEWISEHMDQCHFTRGKIQTPDFTEEELLGYKWEAEHPTGSCRGFRFTDEPTEEEVKDWQAFLEFLNKMDFVSVRSRVKFYDEEEHKPYDNDPDRSWFSDRTRPQSHACCNLGQDPYSQNDD